MEIPIELGHVVTHFFNCNIICIFVFIFIFISNIINVIIGIIIPWGEGAPKSILSIFVPLKNEPHPTGGGRAVFCTCISAPFS